MTLFSAYEDFVGRTLGVLEGPWAKLLFISELRGEKGRYEHWGLEYTHGPVNAKKAIAQAHTDMFQGVLETPLPALLEEFQAARVKAGSALADQERMIPIDRNGCSVEHFRYVLTALTLLADSHSNRQAA